MSTHRKPRTGPQVHNVLFAVAGLLVIAALLVAVIAYPLPLALGIVALVFIRPRIRRAHKRAVRFHKRWLA